MVIGELKYLESIELSYNLHSNYACTYSEDNRVCFLNENGCYIFHLCPKKDYIWPVFSMEKYFLSTPTFDLSEKLGIIFEDIMETLPRFDIYEATLREDLSSKSNFFNPLEGKILSAKWSPSGIVNRNSCALAVLTNKGALALYMKARKEDFQIIYHCFANITNTYVNIVQNNWNDVKGSSSINQLNELKNRSCAIKPTAFNWSKLFNSEQYNYCYLSVSHCNGDITIWKLKEQNSLNAAEVNLELVGKCSTNMENISTIHWFQFKESALIYFGNLKGVLSVLPVRNLKSDKLVFSSELKLWTEEDEIRVNYTDVLYCEKKLFFVAVKDPYLIIYLLDLKSNVLDTCSFHIGNYIITDVKKLDENKLLILTASGFLKTITLSCKNNKIDICWKHIYLSLNWSFKRANGIFISQNKTLVGVITTFCRTPLANRDESNISVKLFSNKAVDPTEIVLNNSSNSLMDFWDCLEVIRVSSLLDKEIPCKFEVDDYDNLPFVKLKTFLYLSKISEVTCDQVMYLDEMKIKPYKYIMQIVTIKLAIYRMQKLLDQDKLSTFQLQNLNILNNFLKEVLSEDPSNKILLCRNLTEEVIDVLFRSNNLEYPDMPKCYYCKESIIGTSCIPYHFDTRCAISMMQVDIYCSYSCLYCKCRVHKEMDKEYTNLVCPYCDASLELIKVTKVLEEDSKDKVFGVVCNGGHMMRAHFFPQGHRVNSTAKLNVYEMESRMCFSRTLHHHPRLKSS